jgi:Na+-driven multidrug efflux pump
MPQILTTVSFQLINLTSLYFMGHVGDSEAMAGVGMGNALIGSFCMAFCYGLNGTLESKIS